MVKKQASQDKPVERFIAKISANSLYGKTVQSVRNFKIYSIATSSKAIRKNMQNPSSKSWFQTAEEAAIFELQKSSVFANSPLLVGAQCLSLAKMKMLEKFMFIQSQVNMDKKGVILYTDTDSLHLALSADSRKNIEKLISGEEFCFSDYPRDHPWRILSDQTDN